MSVLYCRDCGYAFCAKHKKHHSEHCAGKPTKAGVGDWRAEQQQARHEFAKQERAKYDKDAKQYLKDEGRGPPPLCEPPAPLDCSICGGAP